MTSSKGRNRNGDPPAWWQLVRVPLHTARSRRHWLFRCEDRRALLPLLSVPGRHGAQARFAAHSTDEEIRQRLSQLADSLGLPPEAALVTVDRTPHHITVAADYVETVELPLHVGRLTFAPRAESDY